MIHDYERREVARRLRELHLGGGSKDLIERTLSDAIGAWRESGMSWDFITERLADLIEPKPVEFDAFELDVDSIYEWCLERLEGADGAEDELYCSIMSAIEEYRHPELAMAHTVRAVDSEALLALADNLDSSASMLLKQNDLDPNRKRRGMRRDHAQSLMAASGRICEALGVE